MSLKGQNLGQVQINRMKADARCVIFDNGQIPSPAYAALGELNFGLVPTEALDACVHLIDKRTRLVVLSGPYNQKTYPTICQKIRHMHFGWSIGIYIISKEFGDRALSARLRTRLNVDICLPPTAPSAVVSEHLNHTLSQRRLLSHSPNIPTGPATVLDELWDRMQRRDYYDVLECPRDADDDQIRRRFQNIAQTAHPDRHRKWVADDPAMKTRISDIYVRLSEAHRVLTDPIKRAMYHLCLKSGRSLRYEPSCLGDHVQRELDECQTERGRSALLRSIDARMMGEWGQAGMLMKEALAAESQNHWLQKRAEAVQTVYRLTKQSGAS